MRGFIVVQKYIFLQKSDLTYHDIIFEILRLNCMKNHPCPSDQKTS